MLNWSVWRSVFLKFLYFPCIHAIILFILLPVVTVNANHTFFNLAMDGWTFEDGIQLTATEQFCYNVLEQSPH
jgi:hypothetical protein